MSRIKSDNILESGATLDERGGSSWQQSASLSVCWLLLLLEEAAF